MRVTDELGKDKQKNKRPLFWSNVIAIALFILVTVLGFFAIRWIHPPMCFPVTVWSFVILIIGYAAYLFVHELLRGLIFWAFGGIAIKDLSFGVIIKQGTVFCISKVPISLRRVRVSLLFRFLWCLCRCLFTVLWQVISYTCLGAHWLLQSALQTFSTYGC